MTSIQIDIKDGLSSSTAIKGPCKAATTANITPIGEQTIDGVAIVTGDRVLVKTQTAASDNGIYVVDTGNWRRAKDFNKTKDVKKGTLISVTDGATGSGIWQISTADPIAIGTSNIAFALVSNVALAGTPPGATGLALLAAATQAAAWAIVASASAFAQPTLTGHFWAADGARIHRMSDRVLVDAAARDFGGNTGESTSYVAGAVANSGYLDRAASFASYSSRGGVGGSFATRASDQYTTFPNQHAGPVPTPWLSGATGVLGQRTAYQGRVYDITVGGAFSSSAPVHTAGAVANGAATLTFVDYTYMCPIGVSAFGIQDSADTGSAVWAYYGETVTTANAPSYIAEWNAKNKTGVNPVNDPYNRFAICMGLGLAAGGDPAAGAPTNPSSSAILIYKNGHTWNSGIVFDATGITGTDGVTGFGTAIKLARGHVVEWQYAGGNVGFDFVSTVDAALDKQTLSVDTAGFRFLNNLSTPNFRVGKISGTLTGNIAVFGSLSGLPQFLAEGTATNIDIGYFAKGTGRHLFSANAVHQAGLTGTVLHVEGSDASGAQLQIDAFAGAPTLYARRASGTSASPTAIASGNALLRISADGRYDASNYAGGSRAEIRLSAAEAWTSTAQGANVELWATPTGSTTQAKTATITSFGLNLEPSKVFSVNNTQVLAARDTGWTAMTGTPDKASAFATSTVTLAQLAGRVMSLQAALTTHGIIGA